MQTRFYRLPAAVRALIIGVLSSAAIFGVMSYLSFSGSASDTHLPLIGRLLIATIAGMLAGAVGVVLGDQRMRRTYGSIDQALTYSRALRTGELPTQIEPAEWQGWLATSRQSNKWALTGIGVFALLAVLQSLEHDWMSTAMFALFAIFEAAAMFLMRRRIARLKAAVRQRAEEQSLGLP